jgi:hypothetical protein
MLYLNEQRQGVVDLGNIRSEQKNRKDGGLGFGTRHSFKARQNVLVTVDLEPRGNMGS